jgi:hypothetical protein
LTTGTLRGFDLLYNPYTFGYTKPPVTFTEPHVASRALGVQQLDERGEIFPRIPGAGR